MCAYLCTFKPGSETHVYLYQTTNILNPWVHVLKLRSWVKMIQAVSKQVIVVIFCRTFIQKLDREGDIYADIFFLAATKQLYEWFSPSVRLSVPPSVRLSVSLSHLFDYVPIILSSWNFQELLPVTKVTSMQKVKVRGQRSRSQRSQPNLTVSGL